MRKHIQRMLCTAGIVLVAAIPAFGQESEGSWSFVKDTEGVTFITARSEITAPQGSGIAMLRIRFQPRDSNRAKSDCKCVVVPVIVDLIVESPKRLPDFPFDKYDGPVEKTSNEFIRFELASADRGKARTVKVMPNGGYGGDLPDVFEFETNEKSVVSFLLDVKDGQRLSVMVNGPPSSIHVTFDTTGLKKLIDQVGLDAVPRLGSTRRQM